MDKILLNASQSAIIDECCKKLDITDDYESNTTLYDSVTDMEHICKDFHYNLNKLQDALMDIKLSIADHDTEKLVQALKEMSGLIPEFSQDINTISKSTADAVASFKSASEKIGFMLLYDDKYIKQLIDDNLKGDSIMSVGYKDGEFALIFCEVIDDIEQPPFLINVIAKGEKDSYDDVQAYIERVLY